MINIIRRLLADNIEEALVKFVSKTAHAEVLREYILSDILYTIK